MTDEVYLNSYNPIEYRTMLLREVLRLVNIKNRFDSEKFVKEITEKLKFQKDTDFKLFEACLDLIEDAELAIDEVRQNGFITKVDHYGEMYLRLYGVLNAFYQQFGAIKDLIKLFNFTNQREIISKLKALKIIELRNKLASHTTSYSVPESKNELDFFRLAQSSISKEGNRLGIVGKDSTETIDIRPMMEEFTLEIVEILDKLVYIGIYERPFKKEHKEELNYKFNFLKNNYQYYRNNG